MSGGTSAEDSQLRKEAKKFGLDDQVIESLEKLGVANLRQIVHFDEEDFKESKLPGFKIRGLKEVQKKLKESEETRSACEAMSMHPDCQEFLKDKGLRPSTIKALDKKGIVQKSNLKHLTQAGIEELELEPESAKVQRSTLKDIVDTLNTPLTVPSNGGVLVSGAKFGSGDITDGSTVGFVKIEENGKPGQRGVLVNDVDMKTGKISRSEVLAVNIKNLPPPPEDLQLDETDDVIKLMTDGPDPVKVLPCTPAFYDQHKSSLQTVYKMNKAKRGKVAIVNVNKVEGADPREGTDIDRDKLRDLFSQLHFDVQVWNDEDGLKAGEIRDKLSNFAKEANKEDGQACVVCLLSHGVEDCLYGTDGELLRFDTVFELFDDKHCPNLVGKPKIFIFQACRNDEPNIGKLKSKEGGRSDMMACYATQKGYQSFRDSTQGSLLVEAIVKVFAYFARQEEIVHMMYRVNYALQKKLKIHTAENVSPEFRLTFGKKLFFFPGIQE